MKRKLQTYWRLNGNEKKLLLQQGVTMIVIRIALFVLPFAKFRKWYEWLLTRPARNNRTESMERLIWATEITGKNFAPTDRPCLVKGLTGYYFLKRNGYESRLINGVRKDKDSFKAHAWIEHKGQVVIGQHTDLPLYTPIFVM